MGGGQDTSGQESEGVLPLSSMSWRQDPTGYVGGSYRVVLEGPKHWSLSRRGRSIGVFETLSAAKSAALETERRRLRRRTVTMWLAVSLAAAAAVVLLAAFPKVPNPDYPPAEALAGDLRVAYRSIVAGVSVAGEYHSVSDGFEGGVVVRPGTNQGYNVLMGESGGDCYVLWWEGSQLPQGGVLAQSLECRPSTAIFGVGNSYERFAPATDRQVVSPSDEDILSGSLLPSQTRFGWWVLPGISIGLLVAITALVRMVVVLIRRQA